MPTKRKTCNDKKKHYVDKKELRDEIIKAKKTKVVSDELAEMFVKIVDGVALNFNNLHFYGVHEDVKQDCLLLLLQKYDNFDPEKVNDKGVKCSPFSFITTIVFNQMRYKFSKAKKYKEKKDELVNRTKEIIERSERTYRGRRHDNSNW